MDGGLDLSFRALDGLLLVQFKGSYVGYEKSQTTLRHVAEKIRDASCSGFLVDTTGLTGVILGIDRFKLMLSFARLLPPHISVAVLVTRERHIPDYLLETILRKYEIEGAEFVDRDAAISWLNRQRTPAQRAV